MMNFNLIKMIAFKTAIVKKYEMDKTANSRRGKYYIKLYIHVQQALG